ncbi:MAG: GNAT family N-acetyltransferase [Bacteroidales bacterium]|nr:GNAT family N-acetyltransferase [Bacteroidales bacterium]
MKIERIDKSAYKTFADVSKSVYQGNKYYRGTQSSVEKMLLLNKSSFKNHSTSRMYIIRDGNDIVGRFALINDYRLSEYIQVSFFEAQEGLGDIFSLIKKEAKNYIPECSKIIVGLNGHLNYGAGVLQNHFDKVPLFGLPYNPDYYSNYFKELKERRMFTFKFSMEAYIEWSKMYSPNRKIEGLNVRFMNKKDIKKESAIYTKLNSQAFVNHPYWADRDVEEDQELFYPFRFLLDNEHLIIAEKDNKPVGFYLWYPDFNQLIENQRDFNALDVLKNKLNNKIDTFRFTEIGILPEYQGSPVALALISKSVPKLIEKGYKFCEGGFIFEENRASIAFVSRILQRIYGKKPEPYKQFAVFETELTS